MSGINTRVSYDRTVYYSTSYKEVRRHNYKMLYVSHHGHLYYTLRTKSPHSLLIYEHNAHAMTLCGVHARKHVYMYGGPHVC